MYFIFKVKFFFKKIIGIRFLIVYVKYVLFMNLIINVVMLLCRKEIWVLKDWNCILFYYLLVEFKK